MFNETTFREPHHAQDALSGVRQFLAIESPLKLMNNAFYFTLKALFVLTILIFILTFWYVG